MAELCQSYPEVKSRRGKLDLCYRMQAFHILTRGPEPERFAWLCDPDKMLAGADGACQPSILTELGRWYPDAALRDAAELACEFHFASAKIAVRQLRALRLSPP